MRLGNYEWDPGHDLIAAGAFAEVFRARDTNTAGRTVALKIYKEAVAKGTSGSSGQEKYTLEQEFRNVDGLSHTNIIAYYGLDYIHGQDAMGRQTSHPVLIMEYAEGGTLSDFLKTNPDKATIGRLIRDITLGVGYLHSEGILHRDLKPGNILITKNRRGEPVAKITDFGISRDTLTDKTLEQSFTEGVGTPHYMAPEQFYKKRYGLNGELSVRTDIWALGVVVYRMLTGGLPFGEDVRDYELVREAVLECDPDYSRVPSRYRPLLERCLMAHAGERAGSVEVLLAAWEGRGRIDGMVPVPEGPSAAPTSVRRNVGDETIDSTDKDFAGINPEESKGPSFPPYREAVAAETVVTGQEPGMEGRLAPVPYYPPGEEVMKEHRDGKWGGVDKHRREIVPFIYDELVYEDFPEGLGAVKRDGKWGLWTNRAGKSFRANMIIILGSFQEVLRG